MDVNLDGFFLRPMQANDNTKKISLGDRSFLPLKTFLQIDAWEFHDGHIAKIYVLIKEGTVDIWGFITLMAGELNMDRHMRPECPSGAIKYSKFPAVKIARLAIDKRLRGYGFGRLLVESMLGQIRTTIMRHIGCRFVMVDSKKVSIPFYQHLGFYLLSPETVQQEECPAMVLDLLKTINIKKQDKEISVSFKGVEFDTFKHEMV